MTEAVSYEHTTKIGRWLLETIQDSTRILAFLMTEAAIKAQHDNLMCLRLNTGAGTDQTMKPLFNDLDAQIIEELFVSDNLGPTSLKNVKQQGILSAQVKKVGELCKRALIECSHFNKADYVVVIGSPLIVQIFARAVEPNKTVFEMPFDPGSVQVMCWVTKQYEFDVQIEMPRFREEPKSILIAEDDDEAVALFVWPLLRKIFPSAVFARAKSAIEVRELTEAQSFDLITMDGYLKDQVEGTQIVQGLRARGVTTPVIMLTTLDMDYWEVKKCGAQGHTTKERGMKERVPAILKRLGFPVTVKA